MLAVQPRYTVNLVATNCTRSGDKLVLKIHVHPQKQNCVPINQRRTRSRTKIRMVKERQTNSSETDGQVYLSVVRLTTLPAAQAT